MGNDVLHPGVDHGVDGQEVEVHRLRARLAHHLEVLDAHLREPFELDLRE
jgi:hypothetical protein